MTAEEAIRASAQLAIDRFRSVSKLRMQFGYNRESVEWVDGFIEEERNTSGSTYGTRASLIQMIGSYLGECIIHTYGGAWREQNGQWGVFFDDSNALFPFNKVSKQFQNGVAGGDSILSLFGLIGPVILKKPWGP